jgi:hypothetical protein
MVFIDYRHLNSHSLNRHLLLERAGRTKDIRTTEPSPWLLCPRPRIGFSWFPAFCFCFLAETLFYDPANDFSHGDPLLERQLAERIILLSRQPDQPLDLVTHRGKDYQ